MVRWASGLNVRAGPGKSYEQLSVLELGDIVTALEINGRWIRIGRGRWSAMETEAGKTLLEPVKVDWAGIGTDIPANIPTPVLQIHGILHA